MYLEKHFQIQNVHLQQLLVEQKLKDKIGVIENLLDKVDNLIIGGGLAYTFVKAQGHEVGKSLT